MRRIASILIAGGLLAVGSAAAPAADPANGTVSKAQPKVTWTGEVTGSYFNRIPVIATGDDTVPCSPPGCDAFALTLADSDDLTVTADAPESTSTTGGASQVTIRIRKPDGSVLITTGDASPEKPLTVKIKKAPAGDYGVEYFNYFVDGPIEYVGTATLGSAPTAAPAPAASGGTPPSGQPGPQPAQDLSVTVKVGKASARKLAKSRKLAATVSVSRAVKSVTATLRSGKKVVGKGKLGAVTGSAKLTLKLSKKLKKGKYKLTVAASDGAGVSAARTITVKVGK